MKHETSERLFAQAQQVIPGGVNSPVRAFRGVTGNPVFIRRAEGVYLFDEDDNRYIDYIGSWGPMIAGHAHPKVVEAVREAAMGGLSFGATTEIEVEMAQTLCELVPSLEMVRMVNSGTEATMSAIRLARGFTGRDKIIKFEGCYHGHADCLLVKAGSGALTFGVPTSPGVPEGAAADTITAQFNDLASVRQAFAAAPGEIAAIIVEPVAGNMNLVQPVDGFLAGLRQLCDEHGAVLIFDEVMTGFRVALGGAQARFGVTPDLTCLGKVVGGGMPVGAFGGRQEIMEKLSPLGPVYQAGTLSGNPVAMAAGLANLSLVREEGFHQRLEAAGCRLMDGFAQAAEDAGIALTTDVIGGMFGFYFTDESSVTSFAQVTQCDTELFGRFFHAMLERGVYLAPSAYEAGFISSAHDNDIIAATIKAAGEAFAAVS